MGSRLIWLYGYICAVAGIGLSLSGSKSEARHVYLAAMFICWSIAQAVDCLTPRGQEDGDGE